MDIKKRYWAIGLGIVFAICFFVYLPSLFNGFTSWDDSIHLLENESIRNLSWSAIQKIFTSDISLVYIPLTALSYAIEYHWFGYQPLVYHAVNLILHLGVVCLIYVFSFRLTRSIIAAGISALLFGIHPMHVESVAWVTERKDVLYSLFYMLALVYYWDFLKTSRKWFYAAALVCTLFSVLAKAMALSLPLILFLLDWFHKAPFNRRTVILKIPFFVVIVPISWLTYSLNSRVMSFHFPESMLTWIWTLTFYVQKFFWPINCLPLYELPSPIKWTQPDFFLSWVCGLGLLLALIRFRQNRWFVFAALYYFLSIFFLLRFDNQVDLQIVADRFMYLPSLGICLALGYAASEIWQKFALKNSQVKAVFLGMGIFVFAFLGMTTWQQTYIWGDGLAFWNKVLQHYPRNPMAYNQRGLEFASRKDYYKAAEDYTKAIEFYPPYDFAYTNRGIALKELKLYEEAVADHTRAIMINPDFSEAYLNRGNVYFTVGEYAQAIKDYEKAIATRRISARRHSTAYYAEVYARRGAAHFFAKDYDTALADFDQALKINPDNIVALDNRAIIYSLRHQNDLALADYARSLKLNAKNPSVYTNRALLFHQQQKDQLALEDLDRALFIAPGYPRAIQLKSQIALQGNQLKEGL